MKELILVVLLSLCWAGKAQAKSYPVLTNFIKENITTMTEAMNSTEDLATTVGNTYEFKRFLLRINAKVGFDIEFGKIELIPELELVFQKEKISDI